MVRYNKILLIFQLVCKICWIALHIPPLEAQQQGNFRGGNRRGKRGPRSRPRLEDQQEKFDSLSINFPMSIFTDYTYGRKDWKAPAVFNDKLKIASDVDKPYAEFAHAQDQEDVWLYENWFYGMQDGVIMESGALDGVLFSTSFMFEKYANWTALHVEADPENYANLARNRNNAINVHAALCSEPRLLHYSSEGVIPVRGFIEFMSPSFIKKWHGKVYNNKTRIEDLPTVQCVPVRALLKQLNVQHIDLWILDTEGAEESVLKGVDFNAVRINVVAMECDEHDIAKNDRKTQILERNGFKCMLVERNCMCKHDSYIPHSSGSKSVLRKWDGQKWAASYTASA